MNNAARINSRKTIAAAPAGRWCPQIAGLAGAQANALLAPFIAQCDRTPLAIAIRCEHAQISYAGLYAVTASYAAALNHLGVGVDDLVAFAAERTPETIALMLAICANGAAYLPLVPQHLNAPLTAMIEQVRPLLLVGDAELHARMPGAQRWVERSALVSMRRDLEMKASGALAYALFAPGYGRRVSAVAMRTSYASALIDWQRRHPRLGQPARTLQFAPLDADVAFREVFCTLATGGTLLLPSAGERGDLSALLAMLQHERVERVFLSGAVVEMLAAAAARRGCAGALALRDVVAVGSQLRFTTDVRALSAALHDCVLHLQCEHSRTEPFAPRTMVGSSEVAAAPTRAIAVRAATLLRAARSTRSEPEPCARAG